MPPDPIFPLIQLPAEYRTHRTTRRVDLGPGQSCDLIDAQGPGCVRHFWITAKSPENLQIEITCDGGEPQVRMTLHQFFGVLLGLAPYRIESAPIKLMPLNGYNSYLPVPFQHSCRISLHNTGEASTSIWSMVNWQKFDSGVMVTPYRLHARFSEEKPAEPLGSTLLGAVRGNGFVAGLFHAVKRHDYRDMIWHTGGDTWLIDGETEPHVLRGIGSEDVFGHSFGMYPEMSDWTGAPHVVGLNADCSEVVAYRFFGADSVTFNSSLSLRFGTRANDMESVLYYYKEAGRNAPTVETPGQWTLSGPFECETFDDFDRSEFPEKPEEQLPSGWEWGGRSLTAMKTEPELTWIDFTRWFRRDATGNTGTQPADVAAYAETVLTENSDREALLKLGFDDWMKVWLNDEPVATLRHDRGFATSELPVRLGRGENRLRLKLSNFDNVEWRCWAFSCVVLTTE
ncbi:MAG: DUF2961 domain-containing protein [Caldilineaceae bacterium SB0664_bin_27]|uniref:DUF2961 domain-containing protein n=1 Tax=Caldilineaceae bacterium SB0664_bin_27 TaxID=2605260 RepID=A0A6B0YNY4_9CHLR|nr:DUF2961 domain-containing protein [Caldilineaceae bacterium SB0664_bin_27]